MTLFSKQPLTVFVQKLSDNKLKIRITNNGQEDGRTVFEGSGYADKAQIEQAIRAGYWVGKTAYSEGINFATWILRKDV